MQRVRVGKTRPRRKLFTIPRLPISIRVLPLSLPTRLTGIVLRKTMNKRQPPGIYIQGSTLRPLADRAYDIPLTTSAGAHKKLAYQEEVIHLFDLFRNPLLRYVISLGLSRHDGEEIIQEVFLALFRHLQSGKSRHNLRGWMFRVAHNLALKQRAANKKAQTMLDGDEAASARQPDTAPNPEEQAADHQRWRRMQAVLRALPEQDRYCLHLRAEGLRYREIAATLGISLGSVSIALARSLARMNSVNEG